MGETRRGLTPPVVVGLTRSAVVLLLSVLLLLFPNASRGDEAVPLPDLTRPLSLDQVVRLALERNLTLAQSWENVESSRGSLMSTRAQLLPNASASSGYNQTTVKSSPGQSIDPRTGQIRDTGGKTVTGTYDVSLTGRQNLIDLPSVYGTRAAQSRLGSAHQGYRSARLGAVLQAKQQYYALYRAQELARVAAESYALNQDQLKRTQSMFELGSVARNDVLQAQVNLSKSERQKIAADNTIDQERARLALILGLPVSASIQIESPPALTDSLVTQSEGELLREAEQARPDLQQSKLELRAAHLGELSAKAQRYPSFSGGASYSKHAGTLGDTYSSFGQDASWGFNLGLSLTLFDGLATKGQIQQARAGQRAGQEKLEQTRLQVALDLRESLLQINNAYQEIRSAREGVRLAQESVRLQKALYESGGGTMLEWTNAQVQLTAAQVDQVQAEVDLRLAKAGLDSALGRVVE
jgi:outer membrane protein